MLGDLALYGPGFVHGMRHAGLGRFQADGVHGILELQAVLGLLDSLGIGADHFNAVFLEHSVMGEIQRAVQRGLAAHGGQYCIRALDLDDALQHFPGDGLDVGDVCSVRVGHDGGRIAIHQDGAIALRLERLAGLCPGIVEFAGLTDDDGACADDEYALYVCTLWHMRNYF